MGFWNLDYEEEPDPKKSTLVPNIQEQRNLSFPVQKQTIHTTLFN